MATAGARASGGTARAPLLLLALALLAAGGRAGRTVDRANAFVGYKEVDAAPGRGRRDDKAAAAAAGGAAAPPPLPCEDAAEGCVGWASGGECERNPGFMRPNCRLSCGVCAAPPAPGADAYVGELLLLRTEMGTIGIKPFYDASPNTTALLMSLAHSGRRCAGCRFYRNEAAPGAGYGPPYGLLQGGFGGLPRAPPPTEGHVTMRAGHVAFIPGTTDFFVAAMDHDECVVWGPAEGLAARLTPLKRGRPTPPASLGSALARATRRRP